MDHEHVLLLFKIAEHCRGLPQYKGIAKVVSDELAAIDDELANPPKAASKPKAIPSNDPAVVERKV